MATNKENLIDELIETAVLYEPNSKEEQYLLNIAKRMEDLSDSELAKFIAVNREGISKYLPNDATLWTLANSKDPNWKDKDLDLPTMFNDKEILYKWNNPSEYSEERLAEIAKQNGIPLPTLKAELEKQSLIQSRKDNMWPEWAWGHSVMNPIMNMVQQVFTPRLYEKRLREGIDADLFTDKNGDFDPSLLLDVGENALYAVPYGKVAGTAIKPIGTMLRAGGKTGAVARGLNFAIENGANPFIMEGLDALAYDDPENDRSSFNVGDALQGTATNIGAPVLLKGVPMAISRYRSGSGRPDRGLLKLLYEIGEGGADDVMAKIKANNKRFDELQNRALKFGKSDLDEAEKAFLNSYPRNQMNDEILEQIFEQEGKTFRDKVENYLKTLPENETKILKLTEGNDGKKTISTQTTENKVPHDDRVKQSADEILPALESSPYRELNDKNLKTNKKILQENSAKSFVTNKYGDYGYEEDKNSNIPGIGVLINLIQEAKQEEAEEDAKQDALKRYKIKMMLGE